MASRVSISRNGLLKQLKAVFENSITDIWQRNKNARIGLAISGGVDSMALASLCSSLNKTNSRIEFVGFIVDHGARPGSAAEARNVAEELRCLNIEPQILNADWKKYGGAHEAQHFESAARDVRYKALGSACRDHEAPTLLVAHHSDDHAEGVLLRIIGQYYGAGLSGVKSEVRIPNNSGLYGVCSSGKPLKPSSKQPMLIEDGGVTIARPLLPFSKSDLIEICENDGVKWFEDWTNNDFSFTTRNTVRYLLDQGVLPVALRKERMLAMAETVSQAVKDIDDASEAIFNETHLQLDLATARLEFTINDLLFESIPRPERAYKIKAAFLKRLIMLVAPKDSLQTRDLHNAIEFVFDRGHHIPGATITIADVAIGYEVGETGPVFSIKRTPPNKVHSTQSFLSLNHNPGKPDWRLWDNRFWIRIDPADAGLDDFNVRFFTQSDIRGLRRGASSKSKKAFEEALSSLDVKTRSTVPIIIAKNSRSGFEQILALPSVGWSAEGWGRWSHTRVKSRLPVWDIRYKHVDLGETDLHTIVNPLLKNSEELQANAEVSIGI